MGRIGILVLVAGLWVGGTPGFAQQADDLLETMRSAILQEDYQTAWTRGVDLIQKVLDRRESTTRGVAKRLPEPTGPVDRSGLLVMLDQVKQMEATGDVTSTLLYTETLMRALRAAWKREEPTPAQNLEAAEQRLLGVTRFVRFLRLPIASLYAVDAGALEKARNYSTELMALAAIPEEGWTPTVRAYAVHIGHTVAGRLDLRNGDLEGAKQRLAEASRAYSSAFMSSRRPDMSLASELLDRGEKAAVLSYLGECAKSWKLDNGHTATWIALIEQGKRPSFILSTR